MDSGFDLFNEIMRQRHNNQIFRGFIGSLLKKKNSQRREIFLPIFLVEFVEVEYD